MHRITQVANAARRAVARRCSMLSPDVMVRKTGRFASGSITKNTADSATTANLRSSSVTSSPTTRRAVRGRDRIGRLLARALDRRRRLGRLVKRSLDLIVGALDRLADRHGLLVAMLQLADQLAIPQAAAR